MKSLFICYPKCTTCAKARKWLNENAIDYEERNIKEENPTYDELLKWISLSDKPIKKFLNTSGMLYRQMNLKDSFSTMTPDEQIELLATDGMLVKRPIIIQGGLVLVGFKESEWQQLK
jgi:arsenate reductase